MHLVERIEVVGDDIATSPTSGSGRSGELLRGNGLAVDPLVRRPGRGALGGAARRGPLGRVGPRAHRSRDQSCDSSLRVPV